MEFSVEDGARLVRKLTNTVMSVMKVVPPGKAHSTSDILNNESCQDTDSTTMVQIGHHTTKSNIKQPDFLEKWNGITDNVQELVKHSDVLSAANMLPINVNGVDKLLNSQADKATDNKNAHVSINDNVDTKITRNESNVACDEKSSQPSEQGSTSSTLADTFTTIHGKILATKHLELDKNCTSVNTTTVSPTKPDVKSYRTSETCTTDQRNCKPEECNIDKVVDEFENDITFLEGCLNKTSTPLKGIMRSRDAIEEDVLPRGSGLASTDTEPGVNRVTLISKTYNVRNPPRSPSPHRKTGYSPYRKHQHALSPLVRKFGHLSKPQSSIPSLNENKTTLFGVLNNFNNPPSMKTCTSNDDLRLLDTNVDFPHRCHVGEASSSSRGTRVSHSEKVFPPSGPGSVLSILARVKSGARRSLFGESAGLSRFLPALQTDKPLGYDAYQQFINVTKTDVLPKYYFENEDEEAVYYLKVKYLDDNDTNQYHTAL